VWRATVEPKHRVFHSICIWQRACTPLSWQTAKGVQSRLRTCSFCKLWSTLFLLQPLSITEGTACWEFAQVVSNWVKLSSLLSLDCKFKIFYCVYHDKVRSVKSVSECSALSIRPGPELWLTQSTQWNRFSWLQKKRWVVTVLCINPEWERAYCFFSYRSAWLTCWLSKTWSWMICLRLRLHPFFHQPR